MERRNLKREDINKVNEISVRINDVDCDLVDLHEKGLQLTVPFRPDKRELDIVFQSERIKFDLKGFVHWANKSNLKSNHFQIGVSVIDPPEPYVKEIKSILSVY